MQTLVKHCFLLLILRFQANISVNFVAVSHQFYRPPLKILVVRVKIHFVPSVFAVLLPTLRFDVESFAS